MNTETRLQTARAADKGKSVGGDEARDSKDSRRE